jgi:hypothetical protein
LGLEVKKPDWKPLTVKIVAELLEADERTARRYLDHGDIPGTRIGQRGPWLVDAELWRLKILRESAERDPSLTELAERLLEEMNA